MTPPPSAPTSSSAPIKACRRPHYHQNSARTPWGGDYSRLAVLFSVWDFFTVPPSSGRRRPAPKKRRYRRYELLRFFNRRHMPTFLKADEFRPSDPRGITFPRSDRQQFVLFFPHHQRRHLDTLQPAVQTLRFARRIAQDASNRIPVLRRQLVRENLPQRILIQPARVVEHRLHQSAHRRQRTRIQIRERLVLLQPSCVHQHQLFHRDHVRAAAHLRHVQPGDPPA